MEEGCEMLNDESFEKHVSQGEHEGNLEAAGDGFESDEETAVWRCLEKSHPLL